MRCGFLSSFSVPAAGILMNVDPNAFAAHVASAGPVGLGAAGSPLQVSPDWNSWSAVNGNPVALFTSATSPPATFAPPPSATGVEAKHVGVGAEHGTAPATSPLSYLQLNPNHGPVFQ